MKTIFFLVLIILHSAISFSQTVKTYSGNYEAANVIGTTNYQYYENEKYERVYHGYFNFSGTDNHEILNFFFTEGLKTQYNLKGNFKNNKKDGLWNYTIARPKAKFSFLGIEEVSNPSTERITGNYKNGNKVGEWKHTKTDNNTQVALSNSIVHFAESPITYMLVGDFDFKRKEIKIKGGFDEEGYMNGDWNIQYTLSSIQYKDERKYKNGVLYWRLHRNMSTGEIINQFDNTNSVLEFFLEYNQEENTSMIDDVPYTLKEIMDSDDNDENSTSDNGDNNLKAALDFWSDSNSDDYLTEFTIGSNLPEKARFRFIVTDYDKQIKMTEERRLKEEIERARIAEEKRKKEEEEKRKKEEEQREIERQKEIAKKKLELEQFLAVRGTKIYDLKDINPNAFNAVNIEISKIIESEINNSKLSNADLHGNVIFNVTIDSAFKSDFKGLEMEDEKILKKITAKLSSIKIPVQYKLGYLINVHYDALVYLYKGEAKFKKVDSYENNIEFLKPQPEIIVQNCITEQYTKAVSGKYKIEYEIMKVGSKLTYKIIDGDHEIKSEETEKLNQVIEEKKELEYQKPIMSNEFNSSDYGKLQNAVKSEFDAWLKKTEFESSSDYQNRIKTQLESKYTSILNQNIEKSKDRMLNPKCARLGNYDAENEMYQLLIGKSDTIKIKVSKQLAQTFYTTFKNKEEGVQTEIYIYPSKLGMVNNKWKVIDAIIVLNNYWYGIGSGHLQAQKVYKQNDSFYYNREFSNFETMREESKPYKMIDFNSIQNRSSLSSEVFYLEIKLDGLMPQQTLKFNYNDLEVSLPKFTE